jgi:uncharacterized repeat protein (TIGR01451 family)
MNTMNDLAAAVLFLACALPGQKPGSPESLVIKRLGNPDAAAADAAMIDLIRGGPSSAPVLERALALCKEPQFRARAERALAICAVDAPVHDGVKIGLRADRKEVAPGEQITFTATLCNVGDTPVAVFLGMSYSGNVLTNGLALQRVAATGEGDVQARFGNVGFCGTGAQPLVEVLQPWTSRTFTMPVQYRTATKVGTSIEHDGPHLAMDWVFLPVDPHAGGGVAKLRLHWNVDPETAVGMVPPEAKPDWKGTLVSNPVELRLRGGG